MNFIKLNKKLFGLVLYLMLGEPSSWLSLLPYLFDFQFVVFQPVFC